LLDLGLCLLEESSKRHVLGHDHGGVVAQLLASEHAERIDRLILANAEAYDNWPSSEERPFARLTQVPLLGDLALWLWSRKTCLRWTLAQARAVYQPQVLTDELLAGYIRANLSDRKRRKKLGRFIAMQFEPSNNRTTLDLLPDLRQVDHPTLLVWAQDDPHFGPQWGQRLCNDIPGAKRLDILPATGHLLMEERPDEFAARVRSFLNERFGEEQHRGKCNYYVDNGKSLPLWRDLPYLLIGSCLHRSGSHSSSAHLSAIANRKMPLRATCD
jgi:2-hydroxymuconate-semialdehyde hydrolase